MNILKFEIPTEANGRGAGDVAPALFCALVGLLLCSLPHWLWLPRLGEPVWVADQDELYYLGVASQAYHDHPLRLGDPTRDGGHSLYQGLPLLPGVWVAKLLGLGPTRIPLVWRCWGGGLAGLGFYWLARLYRSRPLVAAAAAIVLLTDVGALEFRPLARLWLVAWQVLAGWQGDLFATKPLVCTQWRVATPCLTAPYLLLFLGLHARARALPTLGRSLASGVGFGVLFYVYFYYWTAAAVALAVAFVLDPGRRRVSFDTAWVGAFLGFPSLVSSFLVKRATSGDWLLRSDKFLAIGRFDELRFPRPAVLLLVITAFVVWRWRRDLMLVWSLAASGIALMNHQIVSALQIENFHWGYVCGPSLSLLVVVLLVDGFVRFRPPLGVAALVLLASLNLGLVAWLRSVEALHTREVVEILANYRDYRDQRLRDPAASRLVPHSVVAADEITADWAAILERLRPLSNYWVMLSPSVDNEEWDARIALNGWLLGRDRAIFEAEQADALARPGFQGPWGRDPEQRRLRLASRTRWLDVIVKDPGAYLDRFRQRYVLLPTRQSPPVDHLSWRMLQAGPFRSVWERVLTPETPRDLAPTDHRSH